MHFYLCLHSFNDIDFKINKYIYPDCIMIQVSIWQYIIPSIHDLVEN